MVVEEVIWVMIDFKSKLGEAITAKICIFLWGVVKVANAISVFTGALLQTLITS